MPDGFLVIAAAVLGAAFGSFLNVCVYRWPAEQSVIRPRSRCGHCGHTIRWYDNRDEWNYFRAQVEGSIHTEVPAWLDFSFARVFQHTAHHVDKKIPLYRLVKTQASLEQTFSGNVKKVKLTLKEFLTVLNDCQMYDYRRHVWMSFPRG